MKSRADFLVRLGCMLILLAAGAFVVLDSRNTPQKRSDGTAPSLTPPHTMEPNVLRGVHSTESGR
jgi:hypothetical protein